MFKKIRCIFLLLSVSLTCGLFSQVAEEEVWFDQISRPMPMSATVGKQVCASIRSGLLSGKTPEEIISVVPEYPGPRAVFLTIGDEIFPGRTYYCTGKSFRDALLGALKILRAREEKYPEIVTGLINNQLEEFQDQVDYQAQRSKRKVVFHQSEELNEKLKHPGDWTTLRLNVVQVAVPSTFVIPKSKFFLSSLCGLAFDVNSSFAFTSEELTGRCMISPEHVLLAENAMNVISESGNMIALKMWLEMSSSAMPFRVNIFETDGYFADADSSVCLFRGHRVYDDLDDMPSPLNLALALSRRLAGTLNANGRIDEQFPEWLEEREDGKIQVNVQARLVLALVRAARISGDKEVLEGAVRAVRPLLKRIKHSSLLPDDVLTVVSFENLPEGEDTLIAREIVTIEDNAITMIALMELADLLKTDEYDAQISGVVNFIKSRQLRDGTFVNFCFWDDLKVPRVDPSSSYSKLETLALAGLALCRYAVRNPDDAMQTMAQAEFCWTELRRQLEKVEFIKEQHFENWMMEFVGDFAKAIPENIGFWARFALEAGHRIQLQPDLPDEFGAPEYIASMTLASRRLKMIADFAKWLRKHGQVEEADMLLTDAWPLWKFQQSALMTSASASGLPNPHRYIGFYRDNFSDFGFNLRGQVDQLLAMLSLHEGLSEEAKNNFRPDQDMYEIWISHRKRMFKHPLMASPQLIFTDNYSALPFVKFSGDLEEKALPVNK